MTPNSQQDYQLLCRSDLRFLSEDVAEWTHDGYDLVGGVSAYTD